MPKKPKARPGKDKLLRGLDRDLVRLPRRGGFLAMLAAAALIGVGAALRLGLDRAAGGPIPPFITFYPLLGLIGFLCGVRIGTVAMIAATLLVWYFWIEPYESWAIANRSSLAAVLIFIPLGGFTVWTGAWARGLFEKVQATRIEHDRLARETVHRLRNLIAVVQALSYQSAGSASTIAEYRGDLDKRLIALGEAQNLALSAGGGDPSVAKTIEAATSAFRSSPHFEVLGDGDFPVPQSIHLGLTLALGELGANSLKYGALAGKGGKARLSWSEADGRRTILWREEASAASDRKGFGSHLIASALDRLPGAKVDYSATTDGVNCRFDWPGAV